MLNLRPLDPACPINQPLQSKADPVVLLNLSTVADIPALMSAWEKDALWMKQQPGILATQPHLFAKVAVPNLCAA